MPVPERWHRSDIMDP